MNKKQKFIVGLVSLIIFMILLFPMEKTRYRSSGIARRTDRSFVLDGGSIDYSRALYEIILIGLPGSFLFGLLKN